MAIVEDITSVSKLTIYSHALAIGKKEKGVSKTPLLRQGGAGVVGQIRRINLILVLSILLSRLPQVEIHPCPEAYVFIQVRVSELPARCFAGYAYKGRKVPA